jgi:hypothetical protein
VQNVGTAKLCPRGHGRKEQQRSDQCPCSLHGCST